MNHAASKVICPLLLPTHHPSCTKMTGIFPEINRINSLLLNYHCFRSVFSQMVINFAAFVTANSAEIILYSMEVVPVMT